MKWPPLYEHFASRVSKVFTITGKFLRSNLHSSMVFLFSWGWSKGEDDGTLSHRPPPYSILMKNARAYAFVLCVGYKAPHTQHKCSKHGGLA